MLRKSYRELNFVLPKEPIPTVEVDIDSLPEPNYGCADILQKSLDGFALAHPTLVGTICIYVGHSTNFSKPTYSAFIGTTEPTSILKAAYNAFAAIKGADVRYSDYIRAADGRCELHIEDGKVWLCDHPGEWYSIQGGESFPTSAADDDVDLGRAESDADASDSATSAASVSDRSETPARFRAARADAGVGTIRTTIESVCGLPAGSVALCGPDGKALRSDATIRPLHKRWEK